ncbi:restriction endonuclease subunit S, partial [Burkholderia cepacia]|uniref:restriction endonuclease subunit S n=1 Tax=Burkholderia cepacia TaxID=292 RepID=UPI00157A3675
SASRRMVTICSSVNRLFFMTSFSPLEAILSSFNWSENSRAGHGKTLDLARNSGRPRDYITTSNVYWGRFELSNLKQMLIRDEELEKCTARKGDLLICEGGEAGRAAVWVSNDDVCFQNHIHRARFFGGVNPFFACRFFEKLNVTGEINAHRKGIGISNLSGTALSMIPFPLPPLEEQSRIVAKIDELFALCDQLEAKQRDRRKLQNVLRHATLQALASAQSPHELQESWKRLQTNFGCLFSEPDDVKELRSLCVDLAIRGALSTMDDRDPSGDAAKLLKGLAKLKTGKRIAKLTQVDPPFELPTQWQWALFDDLLQRSESGWSPKCDAESRRSGEWGVLKVSAVTWGDFRANENKRLPPSLDPRPDCEVKPGDFLLSRANTAELIARSVIAQDDVPDRLLMSDKIVRLTFIDAALKTWANLVNNSRFAREYYRANATGTSDSMRNVSRQVIHELPIPLPPKRVQDAVIKKLSELNALCTTLESQRREAALNAERLANAAVAALTGTPLEQEDEATMKAPQTELIALLRLGTPPDLKAQAPLATILARHDGEMSARDLWQRFGGEIDAFYAQLKTEVMHGWITEPAVAEMREVMQQKASEAVGG